MCGIVGYVGDRQAEAVIVEGLRRLEYRGYDSAGIALVGEVSERLRARVMAQIRRGQWHLADTAK